MVGRVSTGEQAHPDYRVVSGPFYRPAQVRRARPYTRVEDAVAVMGEGLVLDAHGERLVAFHERHLSTVMRLTDLGSDAEAR
jgi:hypothetical protein